MTEVRVLLFDVFGTLVDWRGSMIAQVSSAGGRAGVDANWAAVVDDWRREYQPAMDRIRSGEPWRDLDSLQRETLAVVLSKHGVVLPEDARETLVLGWRRLRPWPDTKAGLDRLRGRFTTATLSNGHVALLADLLKFGDLRVDAVLSAQLADSYKPDPATYLTALRYLDCPPAEAAMVAAHAGDLAAAAAVGLRAMFVPRPLEWGAEAGAESAPAVDGLIEAGNLEELATRLGC